ncbi:phosphoesterase family protein [Mycobacterium kansasii]|uniref:Phosphoesterase family protein n=1 Tax=Mycobacterium kansasii TaxID=1768 RepID=A0A1V3WVB6_MYCKA|nr:phosphoesterase family protein [Mycobacterium kansasii]
MYSDKSLGPAVNAYVGYGEIVRWFKQAADPRSDLARFGVAPRYPWDFAADVRANRLPQVSWLVPNILVSEHPAMPDAAAPSRWRTRCGFCCPIRRCGKRPR